MDRIIPASKELVAVIVQNFESKSLDYKAPLNWETAEKKDRCSLVKDIIAFANTGGGFIVIGVSEADDGFELTGLTLEQVGSFEASALCTFVQNYADPPINLRVQKVTHEQRNFIILEIPRFADTPHLCQKDFPGVLSDRALYVRTDNNESAPIKSSADFRAVIEAAIRNRKDSLLSSFRAILTGPLTEAPTARQAEQQFQGQVEAARQRFDDVYSLGEKDYSFFIETVFVLQEFDPYRFTSDQLHQGANKATASFTGWPFLFIHWNRSDCLSFTDEGIEGNIATQDFANKDIFDFWKFNESGLFYKKELNPYSGSKPAVVSAPGIVRHFAEAIYCMTRLYEDLLDDSEVVELRVTFLGMRNRSLVWDNGRFPFSPMSSQYVNSRPSLEANASKTLADWRAGLSDYTIQLAVEVMKRFGFQQPDIPAMTTQIENLFARRF